MKVAGMSSKRIVDRFFRRVDDVVWDLMSGRVGIKTDDGIATLEGEEDEATITVNLFDDFGVALPAFAQNTPVDQIKNGDLIYNDRRVMGWVIKTPPEDQKTFRLLKPDGTRGDWRPPKVASLGLDLSGAMVLRSLVNTLPEGGLGSMQNMLLPMIMMGGGGFGGGGEGGGEGMFGDMEDMLPIMLMSQCGLGGAAGGAGGAAGGAGGMGGMMQMMLMMKMFGSGGSGGSGSGKNKFGGNDDRTSFFDRQR